MIRTVIWDMEGVLIRQPSQVNRVAKSEPKMISIENLDLGELDYDLLGFIRAMRCRVETILWIKNWAEVWQSVAHQDEINQAFDRVIISRGSPTPDDLGVLADELVLVDHSQAVVETAHSAGLRAIRFTDCAEVSSQLLDLLLEPV
jgi:hypothetical protein